MSGGLPVAMIAVFARVVHPLSFVIVVAPGRCNSNTGWAVCRSGRLTKVQGSEKQMLRSGSGDDKAGDANVSRSELHPTREIEGLRRRSWSWCCAWAWAAVALGVAVRSGLRLRSGWGCTRGWCRRRCWSCANTGSPEQEPDSNSGWRPVLKKPIVAFAAIGAGRNQIGIV